MEYNINELNPRCAGPLFCKILQNRIPQLAKKLLLNLAIIFFASCGKITAPIRQDSFSAARNCICFVFFNNYKNAKYGPYVNQYIDYYKVDIDDKQLDPTKDLLPFLANCYINLELIKKSKIKLS